MERPDRRVRADLPRRVAVVGGSRISFARSDGPYATTSNQDMLTAALDGLATRYGLRAPGAVGEFVAGAVLQHSRDFALARETLSAPHSTRALRRTTSSRPAAPGSRP